jgi:hypothetical protein
MLHILKIMQCPACEGRGERTAPIWRAYYRWDETRPVGQTAMESRIEAATAEVEWWTDHGYPVDCSLPLPAEQEPCPACQGTGEKASRLSLEEAGLPTPQEWHAVKAAISQLCDRMHALEVPQEVTYE